MSMLRCSDPRQARPGWGVGVMLVCLLLVGCDQLWAPYFAPDVAADLSPGEPADLRADSADGSTAPRTVNLLLTGLSAADRARARLLRVTAQIDGVDVLGVAQVFVDQDAVLHLPATARGTLEVLVEAGTPGATRAVASGRAGIPLGQASDYTLPVPMQRAFCSRTGWCWENPLPQGNDLLAVFGVNAEDVWLSGIGGTLMRWNGTFFTSFSLDSAEYISALWGASSNDVWAVGTNGAIWHWNGLDWRLVPSGTTYSILRVFGTSATDVWAVGPSTTLHWDGKRWGAAPGNPGELRAIWGLSPTDLWAVRGGAEIIHWDGKSWTTVFSPGITINQIWGRAQNDIWAVGYGGRSWHFTGIAWGLVNTGISAELTDVFGAPGKEVWAVSPQTLLYFDGTAWTQPRLPTLGLRVQIAGLRGVWAASARDVWVAGAGGTILRWDGSAWASWSSGEQSTLTGVFAASRDDAWAIGYGALLRWDGATWKPHTGNLGNAYAIWGTARNDVWVAADAGAYHWDGMGWALSAGLPKLQGLSGTASNDVWAVGGGGAIRHWDGKAWATIPSGVATQLQAVWARAPNDAWAVGGGTSALHWDGAKWSPVAIGVDLLLSGVWGTAADNVFAVGALGSIYYNGFSLSRIPGLTGRAIWGAGANDIWVINASNLLQYWNGASWISVNSGAHNGLLGVSGTASDDVRIMGLGGMILHGQRPPP